MNSTKIIQARTEMISATNYIMNKYNLSSVEMDGVMSTLLSDIRAQTTAELSALLNSASQGEGDDKNE